ncbi:nitrate reductase molybdenum cofactor assembly chaperone [Mammaliicoccus fleurettii]|uniref:nitrate reductase molybdenum cofactor assembly chaperone n=1 Tax=Mammaliicoccus fleurettii TaxID=150056 RepID=UPI000E069306|nr:nitrate reductase molybdenum cofactor assembly chaperone [Mammaliicoccus fleurettii]RTX91002.1 nitrate reductase molybdenum cofactor assembly chaperone [Mammaliicoccus fleurettii]SUM35889.1 nitrate reductase subunit delta [Mammaliicoccus fleurettii]HCN61751.1 nitrate reductase molybdenum cofactor assembly chaperone [Staphylococcus sp.]
MINLNALYQLKESFGFFSNQLTYPEKLDFHPKAFKKAFNEQHPGYEEVQQYWTNMHDISLDDIQEVYTRTFDFEKKTTLYMTYNKLTEQKERGQMLARLKVLYEMFGLEMPKSELSDFLPLMLEFLYAAEWRGDSRAQESLTLVVMVIEDGTFELLKALGEQNSPYFHLIKALRETLKSCLVEQEKVTNCD